MKIKNVFMAAFAAVLFLTSCTLPVDKQIEFLTSNEWNLVSAEGIETESAEDGSYTINFKTEDSSIFGKGDCNRYFGKYSIEEGSTDIDIETAGITRMACRNGQAEDRFIALFDEVDSFSCVDGELTLLGDDNEVIAVFNSVVVEKNDKCCSEK